MQVTSAPKSTGRRKTWPACRFVMIAASILVLAATGPGRADVGRPVMGALGDREIVLMNRDKSSVVEVYVSPDTADSWGQDLLGDGVIDPGQVGRVKLGRMRDCSFDVLVVYDDTRREEMRGVNICKTRQLTFDGHNASAPVEQPGPQRSVTVVDASTLPIQQLFVSPPDAAQWGDDRLAAASLSVGEQRAIDFNGDCSADVRVVFANRAAEERRGIDLCHTTVLRIAPGWTTADSLSPVAIK